MHNKDHALRHAAAIGNLPKVKQLVEAKADLTALDNAALRWAVRRRRTNVVRFCLAAGAPTDGYLEEFLERAVRNDDTSTLRLLLTRAPQPYDPDLLSRLLSRAAVSGSVRAARLLLTAGADVHADNDEPIINAAFIGGLPMLRLLCRYGADVRARDGAVLTGCAHRREPKTVRFLIKKGADTQAGNGRPLDSAISSGDAEVVEILLDAGVPMSSPRCLVRCTDCDSVDTLQLLVAHGSDLAAQANDLVSAAAKSGSPRVLNYVLTRAQPNQLTLDTALEEAAGHGLEPVISILLAAGADPKWKSSAALTAAIHARKFNLAGLLLNAGANAADLGASAIHDTLASKSFPFVVRLLRAGINVAGCTLDAALAAHFCHSVSPNDMVDDANGERHPQPLRGQRIVFALHVANKAREFDGTDKIPPIWLSQMLGPQ